MMAYPEPPIKRKNQSPLRVLVNAWGCLLGLVMLALGLALGVFGAIFVAPQLLGFNLTATALAEEGILLAATSADLEQRAADAESQATNFAFSVEATQANILNAYELLGQTATQSAGNIQATGTAIVDANLARQTQVVRDYQATQSAFDADATQAAINIMNTQAALGIPQSATSSSQSQLVPSNPNDFTLGLDANYWQVSASEDWQLSELGMAALQEDAWVIENEARLLGTGDYALTVQIQNSLQPNADYWVFIVNENQGIAAYLRIEGRNFSEAALYNFDLSSLQNGALNLENLSLLSRATADSIVAEDLEVELNYERGWLRLMLNGGVFLLVDNAPVTHGRVGVQLPVLATLQSVGLRNEP